MTYMGVVWGLCAVCGGEGEGGGGKEVGRAVVRMLKLNGMEEAQVEKSWEERVGKSGHGWREWRGRRRERSGAIGAAYLVVILGDGADVFTRGLNEGGGEGCGVRGRVREL